VTAASSTRVTKCVSDGLRRRLGRVQVVVRPVIEGLEVVFDCGVLHTLREIVDQGSHVDLSYSFSVEVD